jgi:hypothetical protein
VLDVSKNTALTVIQCKKNQLSADALNALFKAVNDKKERKTIYMSGNPGTATCDKKIATDKGWTVM